MTSATTQPRFSIADIEHGVGVSRSRLERLVAERNFEQGQLAELRAEHARIGERIRELDANIARKNQAIFTMRPELERLLELQRQVRDRAQQEVRQLKNESFNGAHDRPSVGAHDGPDSGGANRRRHPRTPVQVDVTMVSDSNFYLGFSRDVSEGGLFIATYDTPRAVGDRFPLVFTLPGAEEPIFSLVEVAWVREYRDDQDGDHASPGMGVRFIGLLPEDREAIAGFVESREPLFHPEADEHSGS